MICRELADGGVDESRIVYLDLDRRGNKCIKTGAQLEERLSSVIDANVFTYLFIDEIQNVEGFEEVINAFNTEGNLSIFITGSNSYLLSGEIATKLTGRYLEFEVFTLDFREYLNMKRLNGLDVNVSMAEELKQYIIDGGFPKSLEFQDREARAYYTKGIVAEIFGKDIRSNNKIRHRSVFERVQNYVIQNFGSTFSVQSLYNYFVSVEKVPITRETLMRYVNILVAAKILYKSERFDCKSKRSLAGEQKYYLADTGIYFAHSEDKRVNFGPILENILYLYLRARGYTLRVGRIGKLECDFIARKGEQYFYIQVVMSIADRATEDREYKSLESIKDNYPRYLFTLDPMLQMRNGIRHCNLLDFISKGEELK